MRRCLDPDPHLVAADADDRDHHRIPNPNSFVLLAGQHQHRGPPFQNGCVGINVREMLYKCQPCLDYRPLSHGFLTDRGVAGRETTWQSLRQRKYRPVRQTFLASRRRSPTGHIVRRGPVVRPARKAAVPPSAKADSRMNVTACAFNRGGEFSTCRVPNPPWRQVFNLPFPRLTRRLTPAGRRTRRVQPAWPRPHGSRPLRSATDLR